MNYNNSFPVSREFNSVLSCVLANLTKNSFSSSFLNCISVSLLLLFCIPVNLQAQNLDSINISVNGNVRVVARDGNHLYVGGGIFGSFYSTGNAALISTNDDIPDPDFPNFNDFGVGVIATIPDGAGGWYIGGCFVATEGGESYSNLIHVLSDHTIDPGFKPDPNFDVIALELEGNTLFVGGEFDTIDGQNVARLAKLNAETGTVDLGWNPALNGDYVNTINVLKIEGDYIDVGGDFTRIGGRSQKNFARLEKATGNALFTVSPDNDVYTIEHTAGGIYLGGLFQTSGYHTGASALISTSSVIPDNTFPLLTGQVKVIIPDGSGGWYVGGDFTVTNNGVTYSRLVHVNADNRLDLSFDPNPDDEVLALALDGNDLYVGGNFTDIGGEFRNYLAKLNSMTGDADATWDPDPDSPVNAFAMDGDNLYVGGNFTILDAVTRNYLGSFDKSTGSLNAWDPDLDGSVAALEVSTTELFVGGTFTMAGDSARNRIAAIDLTSGLATGFDANANNSVTALELDSNILFVGGFFTNIGGQFRQRLAALDITTGNANNWIVRSSGEVYDMEVDGNLIYICGASFIDNYGPPSRYSIAALDKTTEEVSSWNVQPYSIVRAIAISGSDVLIGGEFTSLDVESGARLAKIRKSDYRLEAGFNPNPNFQVNTMKLDNDTLYVGGGFTSIDGQSRNYLAALDTVTGSVNSWNPDANSVVRALRIVGDTVFVGGQFSTIGGTSRPNAGAVNKTTGALTDWNPKPSSTVRTIAQNGQDLLIGGDFNSINYNFSLNNTVFQYDIAARKVTDWSPAVSGEVWSILVRGDTVYLGGNIDMVGGETRRGIAAVNNTTGALYGWSADLNAGGRVYTMELKSDTLYLGGIFNQVAGQTRNNVAAINRLTGALLSWDPNAENVVYDIEDGGEEVYLAGLFTQVGGVTRNRIAAVDKTGAPTSWDPNSNSTVYSLDLTNDIVYAGGTFSIIGGQSRSQVAALDRTTGLALPWQQNVGQGEVRQLVHKDDAVMIGGQFIQVGGEVFNRFAYLDDSTATPKLWAPEFENAIIFMDYDEGSGSLLVAGAFDEVNGEPRADFAVLTLPIGIEAGISCGAVNSQVCIDVSADNFTNMKTMEYSMHFDPNVLTFNSIQNIALPATFTPNTSQAASGTLTFSWSDNSGQGATLPSGTVLYELCFDLTGTPGSSTEITIDGDPLALEFTNTKDQDLDYVLDPGLIAITIGNLNVWTGGGDGTLWSDSSNWCLGVPVVSDSVLINSGTVQLNVQPVMSALVVNGGELEVVGGNTYAVDAPFIIGSEAMLNIFDGTLDVNDTLDNNGTIEGFGTIDLLDAVVTRYGRWAPGNSAGRTRVRGTHSNESSGMEVGFFDGIVQQDKLEVTQSINLGGLLELSQLPGTLPAGTYPLIVCEGGGNCRTGNFDLISYFPACAGNCTIEYTDTSANLVVTAPLLFTCSWLGGTGNWSDSTRWDCNAVPTTDGNVIIDSGEVIVDAPISVNGLSLNGGMLTGSGNLTTSQFFALNGGNFALSGRHTMSNMSLSNSPTISKGTLTLTGTNTWTNPNLTLSGNTRLRLPSTDTLNLVTNQPGSISGAGTGNPAFTAFGTVVKSGASTLGIGVPFQLYGDTLDISEGILDLNNEFAYTGTVKGNGTLDLTDATVNGLEGGNFSPGASPGTLVVLGNYENQTLNMEIVENVGNLTKDSLSVGGNISLAGSTLNVNFTGNVPSGGYELISFGSNTNQTRFGEVNLTPACANCYLVYGADKIILGKNCIPNLNLSNLTLDSGTYRSQGELISSMSTVPAGQQVTFVSDTGVSLPQDFAVETGGVFEVEIEVCQ